MSADADTYFTFARFLNLTSALGIAILAVPAFSLNFRKRLLKRIETIVETREKRGETSALDDIATELQSDAQQLANQWRPIDQTCLRIGYVLLLGSAVVRVIAP